MYRFVRFVAYLLKISNDDLKKKINNCIIVLLIENQVTLVVIVKLFICRSFTIKNQQFKFIIKIY